jgi:O-antigen/teichoic acid export membrane protein
MASSAGARLIVLPFTAVAAALTSYLVIAYAGSATFGAVSLVGTLFLLVPFADLGLGAAIVNAVSTRDNSAEEADQSILVVRSAFIWLVVSGVTLILLAALAALSGVLTDLVGIDDEHYLNANAAIFLAVAPFAAALPFGVGQRILLGLNKNHLVNLYSAATPITSVGVTALLISAHVEPIFLACATPTGIFVAAVLAFFVSLRQAGWGLRQIMRRPARRLPRSLIWRAAVPMMVISIMTPAGQQTGRLVLSHVGTPSQLAEYALAFQFYVPTLSIATSAGVALWPIFARDRSANNRSWNRAILTMATLGLLLALGYGLLIAPVASIVSQGKITVSGELALALSLLLVAMALLQVPGMLLTTPKLLAFQSYCAGLMAAITLAASLVLTPIVGASGPAFGALIGVSLGQLTPSLMRSRRVLRSRGDTNA